MSVSLHQGGGRIVKGWQIMKYEAAGGIWTVAIRKEDKFGGFAYLMAVSLLMRSLWQL